MGDTISKWHEMQEDMSDREIMNAKRGIDNFAAYNDVVAHFEIEYPELSKEFKSIQAEQYKLFAGKMLDYGLNNVTLGGDIINDKNDKNFSLTGLAIRLTDKINRLRNLLVNGKNYVKDESMEDTFIDIANYGVIGMLVGRNRWKK